MSPRENHNLSTEEVHQVSQRSKVVGGKHFFSKKSLMPVSYYVDLYKNDAEC